MCGQIYHQPRWPPPHPGLLLSIGPGVLAGQAERPRRSTSRSRQPKQPRGAPPQRTRREVQVMRNRHIRAGLALFAGIAALVAMAPRAEAQSVRVAVIGDYGLAGADEASVAALIASWGPNFIVTTGDNNYYYGASSTIDQNLGQYYHNYLSPYKRHYGAGPTTR